MSAPPTIAEAGIAGYEFIAEIGFFDIDPVGSTPEAYNAANRASYEKYAQVVKAAGVKIE